MKGSFSEYDPKTGKHKDTFFDTNKPQAAKPKPMPPPTPERILAYEKQFNADQQAAWKAASTPDPFEEWWEELSANSGFIGREAGRHLWDAAIRWKEGK
jgi:hypothetical protein